MEVVKVIAQLASHMLEGKTFESLLRALLPKAEQQLLKYCASVRMFNEAMVDEIFRPEVDGADKEALPFSRLLGHSFVEPVAGLDGFYQLRESAKREYFELWHAVPNSGGAASDEAITPALRALSQRLVSYYGTPEHESKLDVLYQQIAADSEKAELFLRELYDAADGVFDLGRCQDLIKILESRNTILAPNLRNLHQECQSYLKARGFWSEEYYQTVYYYEVEDLTTRFRQLLKDPSKWILQLYAPGGRGKTMFLRWLTSRLCAPQPLKIPCAKVDFDLIDPVTATQNPWMLLLEVAQQLNEQIPGNLFGEQLGDLKEFRPVLTRADNSSSGLSRRPTSTAEDLEDTPERFVKVLLAAKLNNKLVLIFDTLEEVILYEGTSMMGLLAEVEKLHTAYPNICLILSGRYDLRQRLPGFSEQYGAFAETLELEKFSDEDATRYLQEKRDLKRLVEIVVAKADGNPFQLALYADILRYSPHITEKDIQAFPSDLLYLIRRVLLRIPDRRVRWLLRYGVVPRKLRLSFVKDVMAPYLPRAMAWATTEDDPEKDIEKELQSENAFTKVLKSADQKVNVDKIWKTLREYASSYSWVSQDDEADTLSFHSDVLNPMRRVLRKQKIYRTLHRAAVRHYEKKARATPDEWGRWALEAIYHKFQLDGVKAGVYWQRQLEHSAVEQRPDWRLAFAREVIDLSKNEAELSTETPVTEAPLVDKELLAQAYFEVARANVQIARDRKIEVATDALWNEASRAYGVSEQLQGDLKKSVVSAARQACVESALLSIQGKKSEALAVLEKARKRKANAKDKVGLELEYASALATSNKHKEAAKHYRTALLLASRARIKASLLLEIRKELARLYELCGDVKEATQEYRAALNFAIKKADSEAAEELSRRLAEIYLATGQLAKAHQFSLGPSGNFDFTVTSSRPIWKSHARGELMAYLNLQGRIALAMCNPLKALQKSTLLSQVVQIAIAESWQGQDLNLLSGSAMELRGLVTGALMQESDAIDNLEQARIAYNAGKDTAAADRCVLHAMEIQLKVAGNVKAAKFQSEQTSRLDFMTQPDLFIRQQLLNAEVLTLSGKAKQCQKALQNLAARGKLEKWQPKAKAAIAVTSVLKRAPKSRSLSIREMVAALRQVKPPLLRLALLNMTDTSPTPNKPSPQATAFSRLLPEPDWKRVDAAVNALRIADALRVVGKKLAPRSLLHSAQELFEKTQNLFGLREVYLAWDRLGWPNKTLPDLSGNISKFLKTFADYPNLCGSMLIEQAERSLAFGQFDAVNKTLADAAKYYEGAESGALCLARLNEVRGRLAIESNLPRHARVRLDKSAEANVRQAFRTLAYAKTIYEDQQNQVAVKRLRGYVLAGRTRLQTALNIGKKSTSKKPVKKSRRTLVLPAYEKRIEQLSQKIRLPEDTFVIQVRHLTQRGVFDLRVEFDRGRTPIRESWKMKTPSRLLSTISKPDETFSKLFVKIFSDAWWSISQEMGQFILERAFSRMIQKKGVLLDLRLDLTNVLLAGIPWEFALLSKSKETGKTYLDSVRHFYRNPSSDTSNINVIRAVQSGLQKLGSNKNLPIDGNYGALTFDAVISFQRKNKLTATGIPDYRTIAQIGQALRQLKQPDRQRVLIVQASSDRQLLSARGRASMGTDLAHTYSRAGFIVDVVENPTIKMLGEALNGFAPQIIHFCPSMKRSLSAGVYLDFGTTSHAGRFRPSFDSPPPPISSEAAGEASYFSLSAINKLLERLAYVKNIRPLVILDVPASPVINETVIQLVLRNSFASEVFRMGNTSAVLAIGLLARDQHGLVEFVVDSLARRLPLGAIVHELQHRELPGLRRIDQEQYSEETLSLLMGTIGTALFTQSPIAVI